MRNVTEQTQSHPVLTYLDLLLNSYRSALQTDEARLLAAMRDYESSLFRASLRKAA